MGFHGIYIPNRFHIWVCQKVGIQALIVLGTVPIFSDKPKSVRTWGDPICAILIEANGDEPLHLSMGQVIFWIPLVFLFCLSQGISSILKGLIIELDVKWWPLLSLVNREINI